MGKRREGERERRGDRWREGGEDEAGREESWTDRVWVGGLKMNRTAGRRQCRLRIGGEG